MDDHTKSTAETNCLIVLDKYAKDGPRVQASKSSRLNCRIPAQHRA